MSKKDMFIKLVGHAISCMEVDPVLDEVMSEEQFNEALAYFEALKTSIDKKDKPQFTDNGKLILSTMIQNADDKQNMFKAKDIAELAFISSRSVSGSIRKLVTDGYVEKMGQDPIIYSLTDLGKGVKFDD